MFYICPICHSELTPFTASWQCSNGHCFDCAKEGYVNLLPVNKKKSKDPGDNKNMMMARREFLNAGFYEHLSHRINELAMEWGSAANNILDLGCGEGYYSQRLFEHLQYHNKNIKLQGVDISKSAIRYAAKRYKDLNFCIASAYDLPFENNSFDLLLKIYAPSKDSEIKRVVRENGIVIIVSAGPTHHFSIKEMIYEKPRLHELVNKKLDGFTCCHQERLINQLSLHDETDIENFLEMTPYAWKLSKEKKGLLKKNVLNCELDFLIEIYKKS